MKIPVYRLATARLLAVRSGARPRICLQLLAVPFLGSGLVLGSGMAVAQSPAGPSVIERQEVSTAKTRSTSPTVAEIDGELITEEALEEATKATLGGKLRYFDQSQRHFLQRRVLDRMIERAVLRRAVAEANQIAKGQVTEATMRRYLDNAVFGDAEVSEDELQQYYQNHSEAFLIPMELELRELVLFVSSTDSEAVRQEKLERLRELAQVLEKHPHRFPELARTHSNARSAARGGLRGFVTTTQLEPEVAAAVEELAVGTLSEVLSTASGFHLLRIEQRRGNTLPMFAEVRDSIAADLREQKRQKAFAEHLQELRRKYRVIVYYH